MNTCIRSLCISSSPMILFFLLQTQASFAQQPVASGGNQAAAVPQAAGQVVSSTSQVIPVLPVPRLIKFSGTAKDASGNPHTGTVGITFSIYANQAGGAPLWMETQNMELDPSGHYSVLLGSSSSEGMPLDLFATGEPRWLGAKLELPDEVEQPRVLLVSVPYALKASDADTVGGKPASAFALAPTASGSSAVADASGSEKNKATKSGASPQFTSSGTSSYIPVFTDNSGDIGNSIIYQSSGNLGIGLTNPNARITVAEPAGGAVLNATNNSDQDMFISLSAPGATDKKTYFGPSTYTNLTLGVGLTEMMRITNTGDVGIGLPNPDARMTISAPAGGDVLNATNDADQDLNMIVTAPGASTKSTFFGPSVPTNLGLGVNLTPMVWIANTGNVGINTTAPGALLDVEGGAIAEDGIDSYAGDTGGYFNGATYGSYSENDTDSNGSIAAFAGEFGSSQEDIGTYSYSESTIGIGSYGSAETGSNEGSNYGGTAPFGVWGDTSTGGTFGSAVLATGDDNYAVLALNNSPTGWSTAWFENDESTSSTYPVLETDGGNYGGTCTIDVSGSLACTGSKSAVVPVDGGSRKVALYAIEGPENWFEDAGGAQLHGGEAVVSLEPVFGQTVNTDVDYRVFLTPNGDCKGLYVAQKSATSFVVRELGGGTSNIAFDYRIMAKRRGFEQVRLADKTELFSGKNRPVRRAGGGAKHMPSAQDLQKKAQERAKRRLVAQGSAPQKLIPNFVMPRSTQVQKQTGARQ